MSSVQDTADGRYQRRPVHARDELSGSGLLYSDLRLAFLLVNEARYRAFELAFGMSRDSTNVLTLIAAGTLTGAAHRKAVRALTVGPNPTLGDGLIGSGLAKEAAHMIAGDFSRDTPVFGTLVATAIVGTALRTALRPVLGVSFHGIRNASHNVRAGFDHRYGHLIRSQHRRR